jgi:hypothetical protein
MNALLIEDPFWGLSREHGVQCKFIDNSVIDDYLMDVAEIVGPDNIIAASKCDRQAKVILKSEDLANLVTAHGLAINGHFLDVHQIGKPSTNLIISGVPPFVSNDNLGVELGNFGTITSGTSRLGQGGNASVMLDHSVGKPVHG